MDDGGGGVVMGKQSEASPISCDPVRAMLVGNLIPQSACTLRERNDVWSSTDFLSSIWKKPNVVSSQHRMMKNWSRFAMQDSEILGCAPLTFCLSLSSVIDDVMLQEELLMLVMKGLSGDDTIEALGASALAITKSPGTMIPPVEPYPGFADDDDDDDIEDEVDDEQTDASTSPKKRKLEAAKQSSLTSICDLVGGSDAAEWMPNLLLMTEGLVIRGRHHRIAELATNIIVMVSVALSKRDESRFSVESMISSLFDLVEEGRGGCRVVHLITLLLKCLKGFVWKDQLRMKTFQDYVVTLLLENLGNEGGGGHKIMEPSSVSAVENVLIALKMSPIDDTGQFTNCTLSSLKSGKVKAEPFGQVIALKSRHEIRSVEVKISEPRGKYVKKIKVMFSPESIESRPEDKVVWEEVGEIELAKGHTYGYCELLTGCVASALRFEFFDFYPQASPGSMCPRCSRIVTNSHGVCGSCGEVVYQCRRCRGINYEAVGSFFCTDCGFCSHGSFTFTAAVKPASNATPVLEASDAQRLKTFLVENAAELDRKYSELMGVDGVISAQWDMLFAEMHGNIDAVDRRRDGLNAALRLERGDPAVESVSLTSEQTQLVDSSINPSAGSPSAAILTELLSQTLEGRGLEHGLDSTAQRSLVQRALSGGVIDEDANDSNSLTPILRQISDRVQARRGGKASKKKVAPKEVENSTFLRDGNLERGLEEFSASLFRRRKVLYRITDLREERSELERRIHGWSHLNRGFVYDETAEDGRVALADLTELFMNLLSRTNHHDDGNSLIKKLILRERSPSVEELLTTLCRHETLAAGVLQVVKRRVSLLVQEDYGGIHVAGGLVLALMALIDSEFDGISVAAFSLANVFCNTVGGKCNEDAYVSLFRLMTKRLVEGGGRKESSNKL